MKATLLIRTKDVQADGAIVEVVVWELLRPLPPSKHNYKYRLFYGTPVENRIRYDNERGKGDHKHVGAMEFEYSFSTVDDLLDDFERDIENWSRK
jgi:hypothetical protein